MEKTTYIQLDKHIERIMPLDCVLYIEKDDNGNYIFFLRTWEGLFAAFEGDWLVCHDGSWYCITNELKENGYEPWKGVIS